MTTPYRHPVRVPTDDSSRFLPAPVKEDAPAAGLTGQLRQFADYLVSALVDRIAPLLRDLLREVLPARPALATGADSEVAAPSKLPPGYLSVEDAARWCGDVSPSTWRDWNARGIVPAPARIGGRVLWRLDDLRNWSAWGHPGRAVFEERQARRDGVAGNRSVSKRV